MHRNSFLFLAQSLLTSESGSCEYALELLPPLSALQEAVTMWTMALDLEYAFRDSTVGLSLAGWLEGGFLQGRYAVISTNCPEALPSWHHFLIFILFLKYFYTQPET